MPITIVQSKNGTGTSLSFTANVTPGNAVIVGFTDGAGAASTSACKIGGSAENFTKAVEEHGNNTLASIWADPGSAGGQKTIAITASGTQEPLIWAIEVSGLSTGSSLVDVTHPGTGTASSWSSGAVTTGQQSELAVGVVSNIGSGTSSPAGWTNVSQTGSLGSVCIFGYQILSSTGSVSYAGTGGATGWSAVVATFRAASGIPALLAAVPSVPVQRSYSW